ncbi:MAG: glycogen synthase GlgA [Sarcina sp.]
MKILFVATEAHPFIKTGGLGDVVGALSKSLATLGNDVRVIIPKYKEIKNSYKEKFTFIKNYSVKVGWRNQYCGLEELKENGVTYYFIDNEYYFNRDGLYGYYDDGERFAFFDIAALETLKEINWYPDVIHCHDWQTAMVPVLYKLQYQYEKNYGGIRTAYSIHNLLFQGNYPKEVLPDFFGYDYEAFNNGSLELYGALSYMKGGIVYSDKVLTVSNSYSEEIKTAWYGEKLDGILRDKGWDLKGILNGIDYEEYDPERDRAICKNFNVDSLELKGENKKALQRELGLEVNEEIPMIAMVSRLTEQKGIKLLMEVIDKLLWDGNLQFVILGTGEKYYEEFFRELEERHRGWVSANIYFDNNLAHRIYAGADMFFMPSTFEPCGLGQLIALRYGTIPIVRETGGLKDTVIPYNEYEKTGNGFSFANLSAEELYNITKYALETYYKKEHWNGIVKNAMNSNNSWEKSSLEYMNLYKDFTGKE